MSDLKLKRIVMEVFGGCNYTCQMCPQSNPGRGKNFTRKMKLEEFEKIIELCRHEFVTEREPIPYGEKITFCKKCNYCI